MRSGTYLLLRTSYFVLPTSYFLLRTSYLLFTAHPYKAEQHGGTAGRGSVECERGGEQRDLSE